MTNSGEYGGRVVRGFKGDGMNFIAGATLTAKDVEGWPIANRIALHEDGKIEWFGPPDEAEQSARTTGKPVSARGKVTPPVKTAPVAPSTPSRRTRNAGK